MDKRPTGYTLIELIIVITIMGLLVGASIAGFNTLNKRQTATNAGKELMSVMRTAQERAVSGIKPTTCDQLVGYSVNGTANSGTYTLKSVCMVGGSSTSSVVKTYQLPTGVTVVNTFSTQFNVQTGGANGTVGDISLKSSSYTFTLTVSSAGDITEKVLQ